MTTASRAKTANTHNVSISCEPPRRCGALVLGGSRRHRARCSCGWWSDCYAMHSDTERAVNVHLRRARHQNFEGLLARSSIGAAIADVRRRGIDAHLADLKRAMEPRRRRRHDR